MTTPVRLRTLPFALFLGILCLCGLAAAAPAREITAAEALRLGPDRFAEAYVERSGNLSEAGYNEAYIRYSEHRRAANDAAARKLSSRQREWVIAARSGLAAWDNAFHQLDTLRNGGGTMYVHAGVRAVGPREEQIARLIASLRGSARRSPKARAEAKRLADQLDSYNRKKASLPKDAEWLTAAIPDLKTRYPTAHRSLRDATARLRRLSETLPDEAARTLLSRPAKKALANREE